MTVTKEAPRLRQQPGATATNRGYPMATSSTVSRNPLKGCDPCGALVFRTHRAESSSGEAYCCAECLRLDPLDDADWDTLEDAKADARQLAEREGVDYLVIRDWDTLDGSAFYVVRDWPVLDGPMLPARYEEIFSTLDDRL